MLKHVRLFIVALAALATLGMAAQSASAVTVSATGNPITATGRGQVFRGPLGISTACDQTLTIRLTSNPLVVALPVAGKTIGTVTNATFTNCTGAAVSASGLPWTVTASSILGTLPNITGALIRVAAAVSVLGCTFSGAIGVLIATGGTTATLLAGSFTGPCGSATTNSIVYGLNQTVSIVN
jgi:hypothetical protein